MTALGTFTLDEDIAWPMPPVDGVAYLSTLGVIKLTGKDRESFVHRQLTNAVEGIGNAVRLAAWCNPQGRMLVNFTLYSHDEALYLIAPRALIERVVKRLRMFVLRSDVQIEWLEGANVYGVMGEDVKAIAQRVGLPLPSENTQTSREGLSLLNLGTEPARALLVDTVSAFEEPANLNEALWFFEEMRACRVTIWPDTVELFVPQMLNFDKVGGVVFNKGCYPGQEVISRLKYVGKTNRAPFLGVAAGVTEVNPGDPIYENGQSVGFVAQAVVTPAGTWLLHVTRTNSGSKQYSLDEKVDEMLLTISDFKELANA